MVRDLKMRKLGCVFKAENVTAGNLFEGFVGKFTLTAHPSHGFLASSNILSTDISELLVYSDSQVFSVDWSYWGHKEGYPLSAQLHLLLWKPSVPLASRKPGAPSLLFCIIGMVNLTHRCFSTQHQNQREPRQRNKVLPPQSRARPATSQFPLQRSFSDSPDFTVLL